ncbi:hypothetical protein NONI108955_22695 [Nocardia ninae]|uniref:Uncharacterized protein n=1 Tax=Nocardia ninae NBRC 108245 TaxID=1210091 RepID=A0A511MCZ6_9NOCA|nr:hypothetical protein [Nocardia ninae]GEM38544.1 hypothetical protein NN4_30630 [Nocardia ninae NBRC 108245]
MNDTLHRFQRTKKILAGLVLVVAGASFIAVGKSIPTMRELAWLGVIPWSELGAVLIGAGVFSIWLDAYFEREKREADDERLRRLFVEQAPAMKAAVIKGFAFEDEDLRRVATPELLDSIIGNSLAMRLQDKDFARELYADIRDQAVKSVERWHDVKISIRLSTFGPSPDGPAVGKQSTAAPSPMVITVRHEYTTVPSSRVRRFVSVSDIDEYRELAQDPASTFAWYYRPTSTLDAGSKEAFELVQFTVDGEERPIRRSARKGSQTYTVNLDIPEDERRQPRTISYTYRLQPAPQNRLLHLDVEQPSRGIDIELDYTDADVAYVNMVDFIASSQKGIVTRTPDTVPGRVVGLHFDGWAMPRSGVAFVWVMNDDLVEERQRP